MNKFILLLIALLAVNTLAQTCFGFLANNTAVCSSHGSCAADNVCSCYSGFDGAQCENQASQTTCTWNVNTQTKTDFYPVIDSATLDFDQNNLIFSLKAPLVTDRLNSTVYIGDESYADCRFPGQYSSNALDLNAPCFNRFSYRLPWAVGKNCGWVVTEGPEDIVYAGNIFVKQIENIGYIRGEAIQRTILRVIPIEVKFQTQVKVSTSVKVFAPVNMISAVTKQAYIAGPPNSGVFEFLNSLQYPFVIDTSKPYTMTGSPQGLITSINDISIATECLPNQPCTQRFRIPITINGACSFTGDYEASFKLACHPSITNPANCPLDPNNNDARVVISANSENFCTAATVDIKLTGTLTSYSDATYLVAKNAYLMDSRAYFQAKVFSPKATLKSSTIVRAQWSNGNVTKVLYDNQIVTVEGTTEGYALGPNGAYTAAFNFLLKPEWMNVPVDGSSDFNVSAVIKVQYEAIDGTTSNKLLEKTWSFSGLKGMNSIQAEKSKLPNSQDSKYTNSIQLFGGKVGTSSAGSMKLSLVLGVVLALFYAML